MGANSTSIRTQPYEEHPQDTRRVETLKAQSLNGAISGRPGHKCGHRFTRVITRLRYSTASAWRHRHRSPGSQDCMQGSLGTAGRRPEKLKVGDSRGVFFCLCRDTYCKRSESACESDHSHAAELVELCFPYAFSPTISAYAS